MRGPILLLSTLTVLAVLSVPAPSYGAPSCQCSITCDNGTSCSASGGTSCSCYCSWWTGNANCSGSAAAAAVEAGGGSLLIDRMDAVQVAVASTVARPGALSALLRDAGEALIFEDAEAFEAILRQIDQVALGLPPEEDVALAATLRSISPDS